MCFSSSESDAMASSKGEFGGGGIAFVYASEMCVFFVLQHVCLIEKKRSIDVATRSLSPLSFHSLSPSLQVSSF